MCTHKCVYIYVKLCVFVGLYACIFTCSCILIHSTYKYTLDYIFI